MTHGPETPGRRSWSTRRSTERRGGVDWVFNAWAGTLLSLGERRSGRRRSDRVDAARRRLDSGGRSRGTCTERPAQSNRNLDPVKGRDRRTSLLLPRRGAGAIWLPRGVPFDETDGHVDNLACFLAPGHVMLTWSDDPADWSTRYLLRPAGFSRAPSTPGDASARSAARTVAIAPSDDDRRGVKGIDRSLDAKPRAGGDPLAASYVNLYIGNSVVVFPWWTPVMTWPWQLLAHELPGRRAIGVAAREILLGGGGIHCITQQVPAIGQE